MPSLLLLALRARAAEAAGGGGGGRAVPLLSRAFLQYRQHERPHAPAFLANGDRDHHHQQQQQQLQQHRSLSWFSGGGRRRDGHHQHQSDDDGAAAAAAAAAAEAAASSAETASSLDAAFERLPRLLRPGAAAEQAVHDLGGLPSALAGLLDGASSFEPLSSAAAAAALPWAASLPLATLALKLALTPLSLRSAAVVRSNLRMWAEAGGLAEQRAAKAAHRQREEEEEQAAAAAWQSQSPSPAAAGAAAVGGRLERASARVAVYGELRRQCGVPSPLWALGNMAVQVPTFFYVAASVRAMAAGGGGGVGGGGFWGGGAGTAAAIVDPAAAAAPSSPWPGFQTEGALWFPDLSLPAAVPIGGGGGADAGAGDLSAAADAAAAPAAPPLASSWSSLDQQLLSVVGLELAPGASAAALALPALTTALSLLAVRRGVAALGGAKALAGALMPAGGGASPPSSPPSPPQLLLRAALASLPGVAYALTAAAIYFKLQAAPAVLLHWLASLSYTLALQQAVARSASVRRAMGLPPPPPPPPPASLRLSAAAASALGAAGGEKTPDAQARQARPPAPPPPSSLCSLKAEPIQGPVPEGAEVLTPQQFLARARADQAEGQSDVLVVMAAHHSSRGDALSAAYCLDLALDADPGHARALYARGQARSMRRDWQGAQRDFAAAADALLLPASPSSSSGSGGGGGGGGDVEARRLLGGQALYAAGGAAAGAGDHAQALELYDEAARWWKPRAAAAEGGGGGGGRVRSALGAEAAAAAAASARHAPALLALARSRSLAALGRRQEALEALDRALSAGQRASVTEGLRGLLLEARRRLLLVAAAAAADA